jgi:hypothetical protein
VVRVLGLGGDEESLLGRSPWRAAAERECGDALPLAPEREQEGKAQVRSRPTHA